MSTEEERMSVEEFVHLLAMGRARNETIRRIPSHYSKEIEFFSGVTSPEEVSLLEGYPDQVKFFINFYERTVETETPIIKRELALRRGKLEA